MLPFTVTATSNADNTKSASCDVNVVDPKLPDGKYAQTAYVNGEYYTRYVYVVPASAIENAKSATFTVSNGDASRTFDTSTYYTGVTCNGILYEPESTESVMLVCTVKGGLPESEGGKLTCCRSTALNTHRPNNP